MKDFKVTISIGGRFHAFYLANQLEKRGHLGRLVTSYPKFETVKYGIPREKIRSVIIKEILHRGWNALTPFIKDSYNPNFLISDLFDRLASNKIGSPDIFTGWSSFSLITMRKAKKKGAVAILERGSSHIEFQRNILREEYEKYGIKPRLSHPKIVEKELREYEEADYIALPSLYTKRTFLEKGFPEGKLIHVPYGVDLSSFRQVEKNDNVFRVVFVGGITLRKGVHYLLQAFSELDLPNSELMLIGSVSEEMKPFFRKYEGKYNYVGHVPQKELYEYYSQGSVFVMMSVEEGLALVQPQAMACGLPVICTAHTGGEDIVRDGKDGFVIPIRDVESLKEKLVYLYENPEKRDKMGNSARERVKTGFTWDDYGNKIVREYERVLRESEKQG